MKKILLFAALLTGSLSQLSAQCVIGAACTPSAQGYCTVPVENTNLPNGALSVAYSTDIQFTLGTTVGGFATITDATILSVTGLPVGFAYTTNPTSGNFPGGSSACMRISGTTAAAGTYSIAASFSVNTSVIPTTQTLTWFLTINSTTGIQSYNQLSNVMVSPNPATSELFIGSGSHFGKVSIVDALGKTVLTHDANYAAQTTINISSLSKGVYFLQVNDGNRVTTKKFIKE
ncbi:MAG: T9SS type A sorting domain-containing protein [Bacteroidota bacterium]